MKKTLVKKQKKDELLTKKFFNIKIVDVNNKIANLDNKIDKVDKKLDRTTNYMNLKFNVIEEKLTKLDSIDSRLDSIMESLAWLTGEYKKFGEEYIVASEQTHRVNVKLDNHEDRISSLEQRVTTP